MTNNTDKSEKKKKRYNIVRLVEEIYQVEATSKKAALESDFRDPHKISVLKEKAILVKD